MFSSKMGPYNLQLICNKRVTFLAHTHIFTVIHLKDHMQVQSIKSVQTLITIIQKFNWKRIERQFSTPEHISAHSLATQKDVCANGDV